MCSVGNLFLGLGSYANYISIPPIVILLTLGIFVFINDYKKIANRIFSLIIVFLIVWIFSDFLSYKLTSPIGVLWADRISSLGLIAGALLALFLYVFPEKEKIPTKIFLFLFAPLIPFFILVPTSLYEVVGPVPDCETIPGPAYWIMIIMIGYYIFLGVVFFLKKFRSLSKNQKNQAMWFAAGSIFLMALGIIIDILPSILSNENIVLFTPYTTLVFAGFGTYAIVKYKALNARMIAAQALVFILAILVGSQLFFTKNPTNRILILGTFFLVAIFGWRLIRSVKIEIKQKENLQSANKKILRRERQLKKISNSLKIANNKLKEIDAAKTDFIQVAAHQLNKVPTPLKGYLSLLLEGSYGKLSKEQQEVLNKINSANERQIRLVGDLLNVARLESGKFKLNFTMEHLEEICNEVYNANLSVAKEKGLRLSYKNTGGALPELILDRGKIFEAIFNFVDNAIKYTPKGGVKLKIELDSVSHYKPLKKTDVDNNNQPGLITGPVVRVVVSDTGAGIAKENIPYLFAKFSRKDKASLNSEGTGLGLYVVRLMIEAHGGRTWAQSDGEGKGSKFIIEIPTVQPQNVTVENLAEDNS